MNNEILSALQQRKPVFWKNRNKPAVTRSEHFLDFNRTHFNQARERIKRYMPLLKKMFPEAELSSTGLQSPLMELAHGENLYPGQPGLELQGKFFAKCDSLLPVSGSIKARGGIYAVFKTAEEIVSAAGKKTEPEYWPEDREIQDLFKNRTISVGSTGNLGLSIGTIGRALGFSVSVHMSREAKSWKKDRLRSMGADVIEHDSDYTAACADARRIAATDPLIYFIDDENSPDLFLGYSLAALELKEQLEQNGISWSAQNPLHLYLPCGVGGGPGGITFGAKLVFGDSARCFFAEPVEAPSVLYAMAAPDLPPRPVFELGLTLKTDADGLAVSRASGLAVRNMVLLLDGIFTMTDQETRRFQRVLWNDYGIKAEPSGAAGFTGPLRYLEAGNADREERSRFSGGTHIFWVTGGSMLPEAVFRQYLS
ncbi:MAG: D-serine ammonia-lyase [Spirochaetia bacterium]